MRPILGRVGRAVPLLNAALTAYDLFQQQVTPMGQQVPGKLELPGGGWTLYRSCPHPAEGLMRGAWSGDPCTFQAYFIAPAPVENPMPPYGFVQTYGNVRTASFDDRYHYYDIAQIWQAGGAPEQPRWRIGFIYLPGMDANADAYPYAPPWLDPEATPVGAPAPRPSAPPWRLIPHLNPSQAPSSLPVTQVGPVPNRSPFRFGGVPSTRLTIDPNARVAAGATPYRPGPPAPGVKEKKMAVSSAAGAALKLVNVTTEANDFISAIWDALPRKYQTWHANPYEKGQDIYNHFNRIDWGAALYNLAANEVSDRAYGFAGQTLKRASRRAASWTNSGIPIGFGAGPAM